MSTGWLLADDVVRILGDLLEPCCLCVRSSTTAFINSVCFLSVAATEESGLHSDGMAGLTASSSCQ